MNIVLNQRSWLGIALFLVFASPIARVALLHMVPLVTQEVTLEEENVVASATYDVKSQKFIMIISILFVLLGLAAAYFSTNFFIKSAGIIIACSSAPHLLSILCLIILFGLLIASLLYRNNHLLQAYRKATLLIGFVAYLATMSYVQIDMYRVNYLRTEIKDMESAEAISYVKSENKKITSAIKYGSIALSIILLLLSCFVTNAVLSVTMVYSACLLVPIVYSIRFIFSSLVTNLALSGAFDEIIAHAAWIFYIFLGAIVVALAFILAQNMFIAHFRNHA